MAARNYSSTAQQTTLSGPINDSTTTVPVTATTGFPSAPFILAIDADTASQELVLVTAVVGTNLTVTRGYDSTTAVTHDAGAVVRHSHAAIDFREANDHVNDSSGVHGVTGSLVGTSDTQTLSGKSIALGSNTLTGTISQFNTACTDADFATAAQLAAHEADTSVHGTTGAVVGTTDTQTLTNKTLESPTITGVGERHFVAKSVAESVTTSTAFQSDDELLFAADANASYIVEVDLRYDGFDSDATTEGGIRVALSVPASATIEVGALKGIGTDTQIDEDQGTDGVGNYNALTFRALVRTSGTAGNVTLRWAQKYASTTATRILDGSWLEARRVA